MGFLDMGAMEIILILAIAMIIWGPGKIPEIARTLGKTVRALKKATQDLTTTVTRELDAEEERERTSQAAGNAEKTEEAPETGSEESGDKEVSR